MDETEGVIIDSEVVVEDRPLVVAGIPAYNEEKTIARVVLDALKHADRVVVCDDGSSDMTAEIAERLGAEVIRNEENLGYGSAIKSLFRRARELNADVFVTLDGDGQHDANEIAAVAKPVVDGDADIVVGSRFVREGSASDMRWYRRFGVKVITRLTNGGSHENGVQDGQSGFRAYSRRSLESLEMFEDGMGVSAEILMNARNKGLTVCEVPCSCSYDNGAKTSTHNPVKHGVDVVSSIVKLVVEDRPLITLGIPGILCLAMGSLLGIWMLQLYSDEGRIVTNVALASLGFLMVGFFCLSTAITLYAISRLAKKTNGKR